jgi:PIN domain nuclease of toxin-antitoxin system
MSAPAETAYFDTNVVLWLAQGSLESLSAKATALLETASLLVSPVVLVELEYLHEAGRIRLAARDIQRKIEHELGVRLCDLPFPLIAGAALDESWTRDPFDRLIVAHAKASGFASLISADEEIARHYPRTVW